LNILLDWGELPHIVRIGQAKVDLILDEPNTYTVHALGTSGKRLNTLPATVDGNTLSFTADTANGVMCYEIVRE